MTRVLMLADERFARREHEFLRRLEIGLLGEGCRVLRAVPESALLVQRDTLTPVVPYRTLRTRFARAGAMARFIDDLREASPSINPDSEGDLFEVVHAFGNACWERAAWTAELAGSALVIELMSSQEIRQAKAFERHLAHRHQGVSMPLWCTPNTPMRALAQRTGLEGTLALTPWGVHTPEHPRPLPPDNQPRAISVVCSGSEPRAIPPLIDAFAALDDLQERAMLFIDDAATTVDPGLWARAERLGVQERVTFVSDMESRREVVLETDVLAIPELMGELRTILLDAMAAGMLVISRRDALIEATAAEGVAMLVDSPTVEAWTSAFRALIRDPTLLQTYGEYARTRVREDRPAHLHIEAILDAYARATAPASLPMHPDQQPPRG